LALASVAVIRIANINRGDRTCFGTPRVSEGVQPCTVFGSSLPAPQPNGPVQLFDGVGAFHSFDSADVG
jgi:hypothetical protein